MGELNRAGAEAAMIKEHDSVALACDLPEERLKAGDVGTVVHVYKGGAAYEVEFVTWQGETVGIVTLERHQVRPVGRRHVHHAGALETEP